MLVKVSEFMTYFNRTASTIQDCDFACINNCTEQFSFLDANLQGRVDCLGKCKCAVEDLHGYDAMTWDKLPVDNRTLSEIADKLNVTRGEVTKDHLKM